MIQITDKSLCCGCASCVQKCPKQCISLKEDCEGFLYPEVDKSICIDCGLCKKVCPVHYQGEEHKPLKVYAAKNHDEEIRKQSSSGGIFTWIAEKVIQEGGVVFGARFDENWEVRHDYTETFEGLAAFRGSKYVQSRIEDNYRKAETFLKQGRKVLFCGTPCQIAGLKCFLRKEYENLLTIDIVCHGVPSPGVWRKYLIEKIAGISDDKRNIRVEEISFRDKITGWKNYSFSLTLSHFDENRIRHNKSYSELSRKNYFMKGFLADLYLRPSCYACPAKSGKSGSDITLGDLWGAPNIIGNEDDDRGTCLTLINKDIPFLKDYSSLWMKEIDYNAALIHNPAIEHSAKIPLNRTLFFQSFEGMESLEKTVQKLTKVKLYNKTIYCVKRIIKGLFNL